MIWKKCEMIWKIWRKSKLNSEKMGKIWKTTVSRATAAAIYPRAAALAATTTTITAAAAAAASTRLLEKPVEVHCT
jgi:hypothetical protein